MTPIILGYWIGQTIPLIYYTNVVLTVILSLAHNRFSNKKKFDDENMVLCQVGGLNDVEQRLRRGGESTQKVKDVFLLYLKLVPFYFVFVLVTIPVFFQMFIACSYLIEVIGYTLIGVVVNAKAVVSWMVFVLGVVFFVVQTVTGYSNTYVNLFYEIFEIAESVGSKAVSRDTDGVPQINLNFFFRIAYKLKPWKPILFFVYLHLASAWVFFLLGYLLLRYVDGLDDLIDQSKLFGAVVIGSLLPIAKLLTAAPATEKCAARAKKCKLEKLIKLYDAEQDAMEAHPVEPPVEEFHPALENLANRAELQTQ